MNVVAVGRTHLADRPSVKAALVALWTMVPVEFVALLTHARDTEVDDGAVAVSPVGAAGTVRPGGGGGAAAVMVTTWVATDVPSALVTVSTTANVPAAVYVWVGLATVLVPPSPNVHENAVGTPEDVSVKATVTGGGPPVATLLMKLATGTAGTGAATVMILDAAAEPKALLTSSVTVKVPAVRNV